MAVELAQKLSGLPGTVWDLEAAKAMTRRVAEFVEAGGAGYLLVVAGADGRPVTANTD